MMWSPQQQQMLNAMGYTLYLRPALLSVEKKLAENDTSSGVSSISNPSTKPGNVDSKLWQALLKAAKGLDIAALQIDAQALRSSPHAKRALWPQLRGLIRRHER